MRISDNKTKKLFLLLFAALLILLTVTAFLLLPQDETGYYQLSGNSPQMELNGAALLYNGQELMVRGGFLTCAEKIEAASSYTCRIYLQTDEQENSRELIYETSGQYQNGIALTEQISRVERLHLNGSRLLCSLSIEGKEPMEMFLKPDKVDLSFLGY